MEPDDVSPPPRDVLSDAVAQLLDGLPGPRSAFRSRVFDALARWHGRVTSAPFALSLGLRSREALYHRLIDNALPPFRELAGWVRALDDAVAVARSGSSLTRVTLQRGHYPGNESRAISSLLGLDWETIRGAQAVDIVLAAITQRFKELRDLHAPRHTAWRTHRAG